MFYFHLFEYAYSLLTAGVLLFTQWNAMYVEFKKDHLQDTLIRITDEYKNIPIASTANAAAAKHAIRACKTGGCSRSACGRG